MQVATEMIFRVEKLRKLADSEPVSNWQGKVANNAGFVGIQHRPFDHVAANKIGPVQHVERNVVLRGLFHAVRHRRRVGVKTHAGILHIKNKRVDPASISSVGRSDSPYKLYVGSPVVGSFEDEIFLVGAA